MFDDDEDAYYDDEDYDGPCVCSWCVYERAYWAGYYDAIDDLEGLQ